jgi:hypothetical protein
MFLFELQARQYDFVVFQNSHAKQTAQKLLAPTLQSLGINAEQFAIQTTTNHGKGGV